MNANELAVKTRWPEVWATMQGELPKVYTSGMTIFTEQTHLTGAYDRMREAIMQAEQVPVDAKEAWVYGLALGDLPQVLLARPQLQRLHVVVMNGALSRSVLSVLNPMGWLLNPRVTLHAAKDVEAVHKPYAVAPAELRLAEESAYHLRDRLMASLNENFNEIFLQSRRKIELEHLRQNLVYKDEAVTTLFYPLLPENELSAIVVAGGPTASHAYDWIRANDDFLIISVSTAMRSLLGADIVPDIVVIADAAPSMAKHFEGIDDRLKESTLVYIQSVVPSALKAWPGERLITTIHPEAEYGHLWTGGSVVHASTDLAVKMGAASIYLVGADFCYPNAESHVAGAPAPYTVTDNWRPWTTNGNGERVKTDYNLSQYRRAMEDYVGNHPEVKWYKLGRDGCAVAGTDWLEMGNQLVFEDVRRC